MTLEPPARSPAVTVDQDHNGYDSWLDVDLTQPAVELGERDEPLHGEYIKVRHRAASEHAQLARAALIDTGIWVLIGLEGLICWATGWSSPAIAVLVVSVIFGLSWIRHQRMRHERAIKKAQPR